MNYFLIFLGMGALVLYELTSGKKDESKNTVDKARFDDSDIIDLSSIPKAVIPKDLLAIPVPGLSDSKDTWHANAIECMYVSGPGNRVFKCLLVADGENRAAGLVERVTTAEGRLVSIIEVDGAYVSKLPKIGDKIYLSVPDSVKDCA